MRSNFSILLAKHTRLDKWWKYTHGGNPIVQCTCKPKFQNGITSLLINSHENKRGNLLNRKIKFINNTKSVLHTVT